KALRRGRRGLPESSLADLLAQHRGRRNHYDLPPLTLAQVTAWCDDHHERTGTWPTRTAGPVLAAPGEVWSAVATALVEGHRDLPAGWSLARLLAAFRGVKNRKASPALSGGAQMGT